MGGYIPQDDEKRLGCFFAWLWLPLTLPFLIILAASGGGCHGVDGPCTPWQLYAFIAFVALLAFATSWVTRTLRAGRKTMGRYVAAGLLIPLGLAFAVGGWVFNLAFL